jgi:RNA polymerase sigma-70 factor, ECF subfamily
MSRRFVPGHYFEHRRDLLPHGDLLPHAIARAKQGDVAALHFIYVRFADAVFGYVNSFVHDSYEAEDITQNVFAKLMTAIQKYEPRDVPFAAWILRVSPVD